MADQMSSLRALAHHKWGSGSRSRRPRSAIIYGYDLGNISGALLFIDKEFGLSTNQTEWVATIVVAGSIVGALLGGRLANAIGRKPTMLLVAVTYAVFAVLSGVAPSLFWLDAARSCSA